MRKCITCGNSAKYKEFVFREMMFGTTDKFTYLECNICGCLQINEIPKDLSKYYPKNYYSFQDNEPSFLKTYFISLRNKNSVGLNSVIGKILNKKFPAPSYIKALMFINAKINWNILDVGSGRGEKLLALNKIGFYNLLGIDPYIDIDINHKKGLQIKKMSLSELNDVYDLILFHHSLEHMQDPETTLMETFKLTTEKSFIIICIPVAGSFAWKKYGTDWVQLDAPRHIFIPTMESMKCLASRTGFEIVSSFYDSSSFQFWGSEQYQKGIPLVDPHSYSTNRRKSIFNKAQIEDFIRESEKLNIKGDGDQACFILRKVRK